MFLLLVKYKIDQGARNVSNVPGADIHSDQVPQLLALAHAVSGCDH